MPLLFCLSRDDFGLKHGKVGNAFGCEEFLALGKYESRHKVAASSKGQMAKGKGKRGKGPRSLLPAEAPSPGQPWAEGQLKQCQFRKPPSRNWHKRGITTTRGSEATTEGKRRRTMQNQTRAGLKRLIGRLTTAVPSPIKKEGEKEKGERRAKKKE